MFEVLIEKEKKDTVKIQPYVEKLNASKEFSDFKEKHNDAFLVAGFFVLDFETNQNLHQIDYYVPSEKKVAAFTLDKEVMMQMMDMMNEKEPESLDINTNTDLDALKGILEDEMKNRSMTEEIKKIIAVIQTVEGKKTWILNCVLSGMEILKAHIEDESRTVLKMEKANVMDYIKHMPGAAGMQKGAEGGAEGAGGEPSPEDIEKKIEQLDKLKKALEDEKERIEKEDDDDEGAKKEGEEDDSEESDDKDAEEDEKKHEALEKEKKSE